MLTQLNYDKFDACDLRIGSRRVFGEIHWYLQLIILLDVKMNDATERRLELERKRREVLERKKKRIEEIRRQKLQSNPDIPSLANYKQRLSRLLSPTKSNIVESSQPSDQQEIKSTTPKTQSLGVERKEFV